jgi:integrase
VFKELAEKAGLPPDVVKRLSGHSTRVGAAQDMASRQIELPAIMQSGGWKSAQMVARYTAKQAAHRSGAAQLARALGRS